MYFFPNLGLSIVLCPVLSAASWPAYRFLRRQVRWPGTPPLEEFSRVGCGPHKVFSIVNEAEVNVFLEFSCCFYDPVDVGNLISGFLPLLNSVWTSGSSQFTYVEPILENFEHYFASMWDQCNCAVVSIFFGIAFLWHWNENGTFSSPVATAEFSKFAGILSELLSQHHLLGFEIS